MHQLADKVAVVTGAAGNLGRAVAHVFANQGARLALVDLSREGLDATRDSLPPDVEATTFTCNLISPDSVAQTSEQILTRFGQVDILANIAGGFTMGPLVHETDDKDWDFMLNLNARSVFNTCRALIPSMLSAGGGSIVNVSARAATQGKARMAPYCASKAAVITLTESLSAEHKDNGITVNCILPGTVDTPQNRAAMPDADHSTWVPPSALADVVLFLASNAARCVSGASIPVYGRS